MKNIIVIFADQMHKYALGKVSDFVYTPNLDRLCDEGVLFTNAYSNSPICGPYRGNLFTGMYTSSNKVYTNGDPLPEGVTTLADSFNKGGYETCFIGKWHIGGNGNIPIPKHLRGGFRHFKGYQCYNGFFKDVCFYDENNLEHNYDGRHREEVATDLAIEKIKYFKSHNKPFLMVLGYQAPHYPVQPSPEFEKIYECKTIPYSPDYQEVEPYTPTHSPKSPRPFELCPDFQRYGGNMQEYMRLYYAMVTQVDHYIGQILDTLDELSLRNETVIIFTSDHGDMQGSHGLKNKCYTYEKSCGIPFIVSVPGGKKNTVSDGLVSGIDIYPSCLEYAGLPTERHIQGKSFAPYTMGYQQNLTEPVVAELYAGKFLKWKMIRTMQYKLTINLENEKPYLLFDMIKDPLENNNLVDNSEYTEVIKDLKGKIDSILHPENH